MGVAPHRARRYDGGMNRPGQNPPAEPLPPAGPDEFRSEVVDRLRASGNTWDLPGGQLLLPKVFGFCGGVRRAIAMLDDVIAQYAHRGANLFLLGQIIHNPWVNDHFRRQGVRILTSAELEEPDKHIAPQDCAVVTAFGVPVEIEKRLLEIGCRIIDTSCPFVRRLWEWAEAAVADGFGALIFGRANHDETVVTKSRLAEVGGKYLVVGSLEEAQHFCRMVTGESPAASFRDVFDAAATNADSIEPLLHLAQVSQTTMLYDETMKVRGLIGAAFQQRFGAKDLEERLLFEPTVCRATQDRQAAAVELCHRGIDLAVVVGGYGSSNTRHLYELANSSVPAWFIEDAGAIRSADELHTIDLAIDLEVIARDWLGPQRPLRIGVLSGASTPEAVVGQVLQRLASFLGGA